MLVVTTNEIVGQSILGYVGVVRGIVVRRPTWGQDLLGRLQSIGGGDVEAFAQTCEQARAEAHQRMVAHAQELGCDAIVGFRYDTNELADQLTEVLAYGTGIKLDIAGIGVRFGIPDTLRIDQVIPNGPAAMAGVRPGDRLVTIDGNPAVELGSTGVVERLHGKSGSLVTLVLQRDDDVVSISIERRRLT